MFGGIIGSLVFWVILVAVAGWHTALVVWAWLMFLGVLCLGLGALAVMMFRKSLRQA